VSNSNKVAKIHISNHVFGTTVEINGKKVEGVKSVSIEHSGGEMATFKLELVGYEIDIDTLIIPALPEIFKPFYEEKRNADLEVQFKDSRK